MKSSPVAQPRDRSRINTLDFLMMSVGSALAAYSAGRAIGQPSVGIFFVQLILAGSVVSFLMRRFFRESKFLKLDGVLYAIIAVFAVTRVDLLSGAFPPDTFPRPFIAAAWLSWMLALGSFVTWRDGTLLFQAVPAIALFGLVGVYDTYREATFAFFIFLLCLSTLFARANGREMLRYAAESGYVNRADARPDHRKEVRRDQALYERMRSGPWRWVAGPEWALAFALIVILLSLLGAPIIQQSVQTVAAGVKVPVAQITPSRSSSSSSTQSSVQVGRGPNVSLSKRPLWTMEASGPAPYLKTEVFDVRSARGWNRSGVGVYDDPIYITDPDMVQFTARRLDKESLIPVPGVVGGWQNPSLVRRGPEGLPVAASESANVFAGFAFVPKPDDLKKATDQNLDALGIFREDPFADPEVIALAEATVEGAKTDREKADRLRDMISKRIKYNLRAAAVPPNIDPVRFVLFESKEGYCDLFATAMVETARAVGLPARYVQGYLPDVDNLDEQGRTVVLEKDYHAWCEILFKDAGWVVFDATGGSTAVEGGERGSENDGRPFWQHEGVSTGINVAIAILALGLGGFFARRFYQNRPIAVRKTETERLANRWIKFLEKVAGRRRKLAETPDDFFRVAEAQFGESRDAVWQAHRKIFSGLYGPVDLLPEEIVTLRAKLKTYGRTFKRGKKP